MTGSTSLSSVQANRLPQDDEDKKKAEYEALLAVFTKFIESLANETNSQEILEELMDLRAEFLIQHALDGFDIGYNEALELLRNADDLTDEQSARRNIIVAAVDNLIDFAVAEEYQMARELPSLDDNDYDEEGYNEIPPHVEYELTEKGKSAIPILQSICRWSGMFCKDANEVMLTRCQRCDHK